MLTLAPITGPVLGPDGLPLANGSIEFAISGHDTEGATNAVQVPRRTIWQLTGTGQMPAGAQQWRNTRGLRGTVYRLTARWTEQETIGSLIVNRPREYAFPDAVQIGEAASYTMQQLLDNPVPPAPGFNVNLDPAAYASLLEGIDGANASAIVAQNAAIAATTRWLYETQAIGRAATAVGDLFMVPLAGNAGVGIYRKDSASVSPQVGAFFAGVAVTGPSDVTPGRLLVTEAGPAQAFRRGNIVGAVTQGGGVPTGAVIERGTNANGEYTKFADGTLICWKQEVMVQSIAANAYAEVLWTFPAAFVDTNFVVDAITRQLNDAAGRQNAARFLRGVSGFTGPTQGVIGCVNLGGAALTARMDGHAIGRWF
ncbi:MAG: hypothetical protein ACK4MS_10705 [Paracoccaceae bacterium]